jgi:hypothetical protein
MFHFIILSDWMVTLRERLLGVQPTRVPLSRPSLSHLARLPVRALGPPQRSPQDLLARRASAV